MKMQLKREREMSKLMLNQGRSYNNVAVNPFRVPSVLTV